MLTIRLSEVTNRATSVDSWQAASASGVGSCLSQTARLALTTAAQRPPAATDSMHMGLGCSARSGEPSAPYFDLASTPGRLCARREVRINMDSSDELVDSTIY
jgi:hypothetical protein